MVSFEIHLAEESAIRALCSQSALTWEGLDFGEESQKDLAEWLTANSLVKADKLDVYVWYGITMNSVYGLTGDNRYPNDLCFVSIPLDNFDVHKLALKRLEVGARWLDDIVANNQRREEEKH